MNKKLLSAIFLTLALAGCGYPDEVTIFPGSESLMVGMCDINGGFVRGNVTERNRQYYRSSRAGLTYRTTYHVECANGVVIERTFEAKAD